MKISKELIDEVKLHFQSIKADFDSRAINEIIFPEVAAQPVIDRIPLLIAKAVAAGRDYAEICEVSDFENAAEAELFSGERLFFIKQNTWKWALLECAPPEPEWLIGAALMVYKFCISNDLRPKLMPHRSRSIQSGEKSAGWYYSKMIVRWQKEHINKLLGITG